MSHLNYDLYIYDNNGTQFTNDTDGNGMVNVDVHIHDSTRMITGIYTLL